MFPADAQTSAPVRSDTVPPETIEMTLSIGEAVKCARVHLNSSSTSETLRKHSWYGNGCFHCMISRVEFFRNLVRCVLLAAFRPGAPEDVGNLDGWAREVERVIVQRRDSEALAFLNSTTPIRKHNNEVARKVSVREVTMSLLLPCRCTLMR